MNRRLFVLVILLALATQVSGAPTRAAGGPLPTPPGPEECLAEPRTGDEVAALVPTGEVDVAALEATFVATDLPTGERPPAETITAIEPLLREYFACSNAGDIPRLLGLFTDAFIGRGLAAGGATPEEARTLVAPDEPLPLDERDVVVGIHHARVLPDGRVVAVVADNDGPQGRSSVFTFAHESERWLIDGIADLPEDQEYDNDAIIGTTYTYVDSNASLSDGSFFDYDYLVYYSYGLEWGPAWQGFKWIDVWGSEVDQSSPLAGLQPDFELRSGTSTLGFESFILAPGESLVDACADDATVDAGVLSALLGSAATGWYDAATATPALDDAGQPIRGQEADRLWVAYDIAYFPNNDRKAGGGAGIPTRVWYECRAIAGRHATIEIVHLAPVATYAEEAAIRDQILATIEA